MQWLSWPKFQDMRRKTTDTVSKLSSISPALRSLRMICRLNESMIDPYIIQGIESSEMSHIQVDPGSTFSIIPRKVMQHLGIPTHRLSATQTTIYGFNANGTCLMEKVKLKCQIKNLRSEVTCYIIDADAFYNLLLGRPSIHRNSILQSTLHQVMKYVDEKGEMKTLIIEKHPFKG